MWASRVRGAARGKDAIGSSTGLGVANRWRDTLELKAAKPERGQARQGCVASSLRLGLDDHDVTGNSKATEVAWAAA